VRFLPGVSRVASREFSFDHFARAFSRIGVHDVLSHDPFPGSTNQSGLAHDHRCVQTILYETQLRSFRFQEAMQRALGASAWPSSFRARGADRARLPGARSDECKTRNQAGACIDAAMERRVERTRGRGAHNLPAGSNSKKGHMSMPRRDKMQAAAIERFGGPEELTLHTLFVPKPKADEVLVRVAAAGVGAWDPSVREGEYFEEAGEDAPRFPYVLGVDGAGTVAAVGSRVKKFREGDEVYGYDTDIAKAGFYAEYARLKVHHAAHVPNGLDLEQAGAMPADALTALSGLDELKLKSGEKLAIFGASGGIGHIALQLAKRMGAEVLAIASGDDGVELARRLGADAVVDGRSSDVEKAVGEFAPDGLDAVLITASSKGLDAVMKAIRKGGRAAYPNGVEPEPNGRAGVKIKGYDGRSEPELFERLNHLIEMGPFTVHLGAQYSLDQAAEAHRAVERHHLGKVALKVEH
jgi:NADPH2:quinone reductase